VNQENISPIREDQVVSGALIRVTGLTILAQVAVTDRDVVVIL